MRLLLITIMMSLAIMSTAVAQKVKGKKAPAITHSRVDKKLEREILKAENQLRQAMVKCDADLLEHMLADYYADTFEGSDRAVSKKTTIARCKSGVLHYYSIEENREISVRADIVVIEGLSHTKSDANDEMPGRQVYVKRLWTKKQGSWQLITQIIERSDKESDQEE
jgi:hypothetical protein